jgi:DHA2 family multidrug resistance protein
MFTFSSALCGLAGNLPEIVLFRVLQGASGASLMPLSQSIMYDIHPPERRAQSMAVWGMGNMAAPMLGPVLGGWLTENWSWHWVFFVNIPVGIVCFIGLATFLSQSDSRERRPFDGVGYGFLVCFIGGIQLMLDRGQSVGWFDAPEIWTELIIAALGIYLFLVHALTSKNPFFHPSIMSNTSLLSTAFLGSVITATMMSATALQPLMVQRLLGYSVLQAGVIAAPRGIGLLIGMQAANLLLSARVGARTLMSIGMLSSGVSLLMMSQFSLQMDAAPLVITGLIGGLGGPLVFMPVSLMALGALEPELRTEGATMFNLFRNLGSSLGIAVVSVLQVRDAQAARAQLLQHLRPDNPLVRAYMPGAFQSPGGVAQLNAMASQQAEMMAYIEVFALLGIVSIACMPLILLMKSSPLVPVRPAEAEALIE